MRARTFVVAGRSLVFVAGLSLGLPLTAQIVIEVRAATPLITQTQSGTSTLPVNTVLTSMQGVSSSYSVGPCTANGRTSVLYASSATSADVLVYNGASTSQISNQYAWCSGGPASSGDHSIRVSLSSPVAVAGHVLVSVGGGIRGVGYASYAIDVGDDATPEISAASDVTPNGDLLGFVERAVELGPTPLRILLRARASVGSGSNVAAADFAVAFRQGAGRVGVTGAPCGAQLVGTLAQNHLGSRLDLHATSTLNQPLPFLIVGTQDLAIAIPPSQCLLRTDLATVAPIVLTQGTWSTTVPLPTPLPPVDLRAQILAASVINSVHHWFLSEGLRFRLP